MPSAKFSGVTVRKSSTTRGRASQCPTRDLPKTAKRAIQKKNSGSRWQAEAGAGTARFAPLARLPSHCNYLGPVSVAVIRGQPFFRADCRPATAGRRVPAARRLAIVSCGTPFDVCTVPSAKFSGVTVPKFSTTRGHFPQCPTRDLPKTTKRAIQKKNSGSRWQAEAGVGTARFAPLARLPTTYYMFRPRISAV